MLLARSFPHASAAALSADWCSIREAKRTLPRDIILQTSNSTSREIFTLPSQGKFQNYFGVARGRRPRQVGPKTAVVHAIVEKPLNFYDYSLVYLPRLGNEDWLIRNSGAGS